MILEIRTVQVYVLLPNLIGRSYEPVQTVFRVNPTQLIENRIVIVHHRVQINRFTVYDTTRHTGLFVKFYTIP